MGVTWCFLSFTNGESLWVSRFFKENIFFSKLYEWIHGVC